MGDLEKTTRREFLRKGLKVASAFGMVSFFASMGFSFKRSHDASKLKEEDKWDYKGDLIKCDINGMNLLFYGVMHTPYFAEQNFNDMHKLVKNASFVISEGDLEFKRGAGEYFKVLHDLCSIDGKSVVNLDSGKSFLVNMDMYSPFIGCYMLNNVLKNKHLSEEGNKDLLKSSVMVGLAYSSFFNSGGLNWRDIFAKSDFAYPYNNLSSASLKHKYCFNHIMDQRNIKIAERILKLPELLDKEDFEKGDYVLVNYGALHPPAIVEYMQNPGLRKFKSKFYSWNCDLIDSDEIIKYTPCKGGWDKKILMD